MWLAFGLGNYREMIEKKLYNTIDNAIAGFNWPVQSRMVEQENAEILLPGRLKLQQPFDELVELKKVFASSQQQLEAAQLQIETLTNANKRFRQKLIRLAKICMQARHLAHHDKLTGLPNRSLLLDRLKQAMGQTTRHHKQVALLFIDLDKFKNVNDRFGHLAGDKLLQQVADRLVNCVRYGDTVCRYGGDEFVVMLTEVDAKESAVAMMEKIRSRLSTAYALDGHIIEITASIGISVYKADGQNYNDLIKQADIAMYVAKVAQKQVNPVHQSHTETAFS
jgi:diguanylate cyclase